MKLTNHQKVQLFNALNDSWAATIPVPVVKRILRLSSASDIARRVNKAVTQIVYHVRAAHVPGPTVRLNKRWFWTATDARIVEEYLTGPKKYTPRRSRYSEEELADMRRLYRSGWTQWEIARKYNATQSMVSRIVNGRKYHAKATS